MEGAIWTEFGGTGALNMVVALLILAGVVLLTAAVRLMRIRLRERREETRELPPLVYPARRVDERRPSAAAVLPPGEHVMFNSTAPPMQIVRERAEAPQEAGGASRGNGVAGSSDGSAEVESGHGVDTDDVTLQLLPGRLEPVDPGVHQEIRFVRLPGVNRFTLGRNPGPAHSHIQLLAATASRMHAYMMFSGGQWHLGNISQTNAVVLNGTALNGDSPQALTEGDRVEFGELTFVFRER